MKILVTGVAGFIGYHTADRLLLNKKNKVVGIDSINNYYDKKLKFQCLKNLKKKHKKNFHFKKINLCQKNSLVNLFRSHKFDKVINLAAQVGVRYSLKNPNAYFESNLSGFFNILETCKKFKIKHLLSASSSSVYGANKKIPFNVKDIADHPIQFYAATKRCNEILAHSYSYCYNLPITLIRFFTVYGPWGRPDMALFLFVKNILKNKPINVYNFAKHSRDFTYIDDIVDGIIKTLNKNPKKNKNWNPKKPDPSTSFAPFKIINLGSSKKIKLMEYIKTIEKVLQKKAIIKFYKLQKGDIEDTLADIKETKKYINFKPKAKLYAGVSKFVKLYKSYY